MKKQIILISIIAILISSCATIEPSIASIIYDESVPTEGTAMISTSGQGTIIGYNGIDVNWKREAVLIPSGDTMLEWNIDAEYGTAIYGYKPYTLILKAEGILFRYNFQPQKFYFFMTKRVDNVFGFDVHVYEYGEKLKNLEKHFVEFVPFMNVN